MTKMLRPVDDQWSEELDAAAVAFHTPVRMQILKFLRTHGPSMRYQIEEGTGLTRNNVAQNIKVLEEVGAVHAARGERKSTRALIYQVDLERVKTLWDLYGHWGLGSSRG